LPSTVARSSAASRRVTGTRLLTLVLCLVAAMAAPAAAQLQPVDVTLRAAVAAARSDPPSVLSAFSSVEKYRAQTEQARAAYLPRISVSTTGGIVYDNRPVIQVRSLLLPDNTLLSGDPYTVRFDSTTLSAASNLTVDLPIFDGARPRVVDAARSAQRAQAYLAVNAQRAAMETAAVLFLQARAAAELVEDAQLTLERRQVQQEALAGLVAAGLRPSVDAMRANVDAVAARYALEIRVADQRAYEAALGNALGREQPARAQPSSADARLIEPPTLESALGLAARQRPELSQLTATSAARSAEARAAYAQRWPTAGISLGGQAGYNHVIDGVGVNGAIYGGNAALYLRWSALDPGAWRKPRVSVLGMREAQQQLQSLTMTMRSEVSSAYYGVRRAQAALEQATEVHRAADLARTAQVDRYQRGVASVLELLDAEAMEQSARQRRIEAWRDHAIARIRLLSVCGDLDRLVTRPD